MAKMNEQVKAKWVAALRSGEYAQGICELRCGSQFCCLGVLSDLHAKETGEGMWETEDARMKYSSGVFEEFAVLAQPVRDWAGLERYNPEVYAKSHFLGDGHHPLAELNDSGSAFEEIADLIEAQL